MQTGLLKSMLPLSWGHETLLSSSYTFDLPTLIRNMKLSHSWLKGDLSSMILLKSPESQIILTAFNIGMEISSFQSKDSISFQIIEGSLEFHTRHDNLMLYEGESFTFIEKMNYRLTTKEVTVFLLTVENSCFKKFKGKQRGAFIN
jgi:hypothetical protein